MSSRLLWVNFPNEYEGLVYYLDDDKNTHYNPSGMLDEAELLFVKIPNTSEIQITKHYINLCLKNKSKKSENTIIISRSHMPIEYKHKYVFN